MKECRGECCTLEILCLETLAFFLHPLPFKFCSRWYVILHPVEGFQFIHAHFLVFSVETACSIFFHPAK